MVGVYAPAPASQNSWVLTRTWGFLIQPVVWSETVKVIVWVRPLGVYARAVRILLPAETVTGIRPLSMTVFGPATPSPAGRLGTAGARVGVPVPFSVIAS